ncbi:DUF1853 family protein [Reinekea marina]|uniref:DUF1853 family protein n=1 Tax=Reinekea marina TaxID=1310421 RepID=A0ABV7WMQ9_9GAMM|nr:DUF1853 family protein [Reinekea marina]MDN3649892.1 DUF1853 family protein [Reinekea marina]
MNEPFDEQIILNDLRWVTQAPSLLKPHIQIWPSHQFDADSLIANISEQQIQALIDARQRKLGGYFEQLVFTLFSLNDEYQVLAFNQVIDHQGRTLGEMDLLLEHSGGDIIHLELALKFYLWAESTRPSELNWVGAGLTDFFALKLARLAHHQLRLPNLAIANGSWPKLPKPNRSMLWIPGRLYLPKNKRLCQTETQFTDAPWQINPEALTSYWSETTQPKPYLALVKGDWLQGVPTHAERAMRRFQLPMQFAQANHAPIFILPNNWQNDATTVIDNKQSSYDTLTNKQNRSARPIQ